MPVFDKQIRRLPEPEAPATLATGLHPLLQHIYALRGVTDSAQLERGLTALLPATALGGCAEAAALLHQALAAQWKILIVADFDADGATSCALAVRVLRALGAAEVEYLVPNRFEFGYGLSPEIVEVARRQAPDLLITVDNGISSLSGVQKAKAAGMRVLITDHHLPGAELPDADVIVNPNCTGDPFASKHLAGVGVIFYVLAALRSRLREQGWFAAEGHAEEPNLADYLDLVALGTVADVVQLDQNNRILIQQGLQRIRVGRCCVGISALIEAAGRNRARLVASDLGFAVGPRLNAAGRLEDMSIGIECLLTDDPGVARKLATRLDQLNRERREIEQQMQQQALQLLEGAVPAEGELPFGLCLYDEQWHQGVIGILAARIRERYHRPVIAFAPADDGVIKGSARSIPGLHIRDLLATIDSQAPGLLEKFGGHAMAAGVSMQHADLPRFRAAFEQQVERQIDASQLRGVIDSDGELAADQLALPVAEILRDAGPWGQGFPEPLFDGEFVVVNQRVVGERHLKMVLQQVSGRQRLDAIAFNQAEQPVAGNQVRIHAAYRLDVNEYRGERNLQLMVEHFTRL